MSKERGDVRQQQPVRPGRPPATSRRELEEVAFDLFDRRGFDGTSIEDIAAAAGIGRRTFFRYYPTKADLVWGDFATQLEQMQRRLADVDPGVGTMDAVHRSVVEFNRLPPDQVGAHRRRMELILGVPSLLANSTLRFAAWRAVVATFVAGRLGGSPDDLLPRVIGHCALGAAVAAYEEWLRDDQADLAALLDRALAELAGGFGSAGGAPASPRPAAATDPGELSV